VRSGHNEPQTIAAAPARAARARLNSSTLAAPVAGTDATEGAADGYSEVATGVNVGWLNVVAALVLTAVTFQPVGLYEYDVVVAFAHSRVLVMVKVVEKEEVTVTVVSPDQSSVGAWATTADVSISISAATTEVKRMLIEARRDIQRWCWC